MDSGTVATMATARGYLTGRPSLGRGIEDCRTSSRSGQPVRQLVCHRLTGGRSCRESGCASQAAALSQWARSEREAVSFASGTCVGGAVKKVVSAWQGTARRDGGNMVSGSFGKLAEGVGLGRESNAYPFCVMSPSYMAEIKRWPR